MKTALLPCAEKVVLKAGKDYKRILAKYSPSGQLLWEKNIDNEILDQFETKDNVKQGKGTLTIERHIFSMDILGNGNILVEHGGGGSQDIFS